MFLFVFAEIRRKITLIFFFYKNKKQNKKQTERINLKWISIWLKSIKSTESINVGIFWSKY